MSQLTINSELTSAKHEFRRIVCTCCGYTKDVPVYCGDRFCSVCGGIRASRVRHQITAVVGSTPALDGYRWRFITFTIPTRDDPATALDTITKSFRRLRSRKFWKSKVWGGLAVAEVKRSERRWHVHIHALTFSRFIPQKQLANQWKACSPGRIVDIRLIPTLQAVAYVTKYVTKLDVPLEDREVVATAFRGRRLFTRFGAAHDLRLPAKPNPFPCPDCQGTAWLPLDRVERGEWRDATVYT